MLFFQRAHGFAKQCAQAVALTVQIQIAKQRLQTGGAVVDYLIITHYDRDHVGGAERLLNFAERMISRPLREI